MSSTAGSVKCQNCGLVNWASVNDCRRCGQPLGWPPGHGAYSNAYPEPVSKRPQKSWIVTYKYALIAGVAILLPVLVGAASPAQGASLTTLCLFLAFGVVAIGKLLLVIQMFRTSMLWGLAGLLLSPISTLIYIATHWAESKDKVLMALGALAYAVLLMVAVEPMFKPKPNPAPAVNAAGQSAPATTPSSPLPLKKTSFPVKQRR